MAKYTFFFKAFCVIMAFLIAVYLYNNITVTVFNNGIAFNLPLHYAIDYYIFDCDIPTIIYP
jgi:hypothetical protein